MRENLKNVLLFMESSGVLVPPAADATKKELWDETWKRVDRFLPDLQAEIAPQEEPKPESNVSTQNVASTVSPAQEEASREGKPVEQKSAAANIEGKTV